jgi:tetratricopeptide (TPR) repeat protein
LNNDSLAMMNYSKAIELPNARPELFSEVGSMFQKKGLYNEAVEVFRKKMQNGEGTVSDYYNFGRALLGASKFAEADSMFQKVTEMQPEWPNGYFMRANANANLDPESTAGLAKPHYEKFIELTASDTTTANKYSKNLIEAYKYLGYYYFLNKDLPQSKSYWSKVLLIDPKDKVALEAIKKL